MGTKSMWTPDMDEQLIRMREAGASWSVLAATFRCAESCVQLRHIKLTDPAKCGAYKKRKREQQAQLRRAPWEAQESEALSAPESACPSAVDPRTGFLSRCPDGER